MDLFSRRIVGYAMSERIDRALVLDALREALTRRPGARDVIHHSERTAAPGPTRAIGLSPDRRLKIPYRLLALTLVSRSL